MKKTSNFFRAIAAMAIFILLFSCSTFASPAINIVSSEDAVRLALFYYCLNTPSDQIVNLDDYKITPLYDIDGNVTYYCVDFFLEEAGKGYVVIGSNLNYLQCTEFSLDESSTYLLNDLQYKENIYFNPFEQYTISNSDRTTHLQNNNQTEEFTGAIFNGSLIKNRNVLTSVASSNYPEDNLFPFDSHPSDYLRGLGFTNPSTVTFGTIETKMRNAGAFVPMYDLSEGPREMVYGAPLSNQGHCAITAMANILMYWRSICCGNYPSNYDWLFDEILDVACDLNYFSRTGSSGMNHQNIPHALLTMNSRNGYNGRTYSNTTTSWSFVTTYINAEWPIYFRASYYENEENLPYSNHANIIFGYNQIEAWRDNDFQTYNFVKIFDVAPTYNGGGIRYLCWDALVNAYHHTYNGEYTDANFTTAMYTFCPYQ